MKRGILIIGGIVIPLALAAGLGGYFYGLPDFGDHVILVQSKVEADKASPSEPAPPSVVLPDPAKATLLVRSTLITLNDAIQTGNYEVLSARGSPAFRKDNSIESLKTTFSPLAARHIDLSAVTVLRPVLTRPPQLSDQGVLRIEGYFPGTPLQIHFTLDFESVEGQWRIRAIGIRPVDVTGAQQPQGPAGGQAPEAPSETPAPGESKKP